MTGAGGAGGGGVLAHRVEGAGTPLLLLNGLLMSTSSWDRVAPALASRHTLVRCDFRGQVRSPGKPPADLEGHVADVVALADHLGLQRVHLLGTSFGAVVATVLAARHPGRVRSLTAVTGGDHASAELRAGLDAFADGCRAVLAGGRVEAFLERADHHIYSPAWRAAHEAALAARVPHLASLPRSWWESACDLMASVRGYDLRPLLPAVACPTLVLAADLDRVFPLERATALASGIRGARLEVVAGCGHVLVHEAPEAFLQATLPFLAGVDGRPGPGASAPEATLKEET